MSNYNDEIMNESDIECLNCRNLKDSEGFSLDLDKEYCDSCYNSVQLIKKLNHCDYSTILITKSNYCKAVYLLPLNPANPKIIKPSTFGVSFDEFRQLLSDCEILENPNKDFEMIDSEVEIIKIPEL